MVRDFDDAKRLTSRLRRWPLLVECHFGRPPSIRLSALAECGGGTEQAAPPKTQRFLSFRRVVVCLRGPTWSVLARKQRFKPLSPKGLAGDGSYKILVGCMRNAQSHAGFYVKLPKIVDRLAEMV